MTEIERYRQNSRRLLTFDGFERHPTCPALVLTGEYDHFIQPWEHAVSTHTCGNTEFALIHGASHLTQFERHEACARLYGPFLRDEALPERVGGNTRIPCTCLLGLERRFEVRHRLAQGHARLEHPQLGVYAVELVELGYFGGRLHAEPPEFRPQRGWRLCYDDLADLDILSLHSTIGGFAFIFLHSDPAANAGLADLLAAWQRAKVA